MKRNIIPLFIILLFGILLVFYWAPTNKEITHGEIRAAIDIGSGATNLKVAEVDPQTNILLVQLYEKSIPVPYQKHLEQSTNETFDKQVMDQGIHAIKELKQAADQYHVKKVIAVATAAFRKAKNGEEFAREISKETGVQVRVINQDEEGILAFRAALALTRFNPNETLTWDIGGGSMQLTTLSNGAYVVEKGKTASIPFKNDVIEKIEHRDLKMIQTPNPMTLMQMKEAAEYAAKLSQETHPSIKEKINHPKTHILAVGSLFNYGIKPLVGSNEVKAKELDKKVMQLAGKTDAELTGGSLAEVAVTNPLLVLGFMQGLHMDHVEVISVNNADGALAYPAYWNN